MICLAYLSTATELMKPEALADLVSRSAANNVRRQVTGMLCYYDGSFLQFLEGPDVEVEATLAVIRADRRHTALVEMYRAPIDHRAFGDWSMALLGGDSLDEGQRSQLRNLRQFDWRETSDTPHRPILEDLLRTFRAWMR